MRRNHKHCLDTAINAVDVFNRVLQTFKTHEEEMERLRGLVDGNLIPYPPTVTESFHPLQSISSIRIENAIERLARSSPPLPVITAQQVLDDVAQRDRINYYKTRTRFIETLGPVDGDLARIRITEVLADLALLGLIPAADYEQSEAAVDALFNKLDEKTIVKLQAFVFTRCERKQKIIERHPHEERKRGRERELMSNRLKQALKEEKATYIAEFKKRVTCSSLCQ